MNSLSRALPKQPILGSSTRASTSRFYWYLLEATTILACTMYLIERPRG